MILIQAPGPSALQLGPVNSCELPKSAPTLVRFRADLKGLAAKANFSRPEAAAYLGVSAQTLASWACNKRVDIPFVKIGRRVQYRRIDLEAFCAANRKGLPTSTGVQQ